MCADWFLKYYGECIERESADHAENDSIWYEYNYRDDVSTSGIGVPR